MISRHWLKVSALLLAITRQAKAVAEWGQCGGEGYYGATTCDPGLACIYLNKFYSQCQRSSSTIVRSTVTGPTMTDPSLSTSSGTVANPTQTLCLDAKYKASGKTYFGTVATNSDLSSSLVSDIITRCLGAITTADALNWNATEPSLGSFDFALGDFAVDWSAQNNKLVRGHTLVWHSQLPAWVNAISDAATLTSVIQNHIDTVAGRYRGKLYAWDVVNEIFNENGTLRSSVFYNVLGESFVSISFAAAKAADPSAKLYINDFHLDTTYVKTQSLVAYVKKWKAAGVPIDGIGSETRLSAGSAAGVPMALQLLATAGTEVAVTELDIIGSPPSDYITIFNACLELSACVGISVSGVLDGESWLDRSRLWDTNGQPKPALTTILNLP